MGEFELSKTTFLDSLGRTVARVRGFMGMSTNPARQRSIGLSSLDPTETFANHLLRPRGAPLAQRDLHYVALGDAGLRGYSPLLRVEDVFSANLELARAVFVPARHAWLTGVWLSVLGDIGLAHDDLRDFTAFADAGLGASLRGRIFDREVQLRADFPLYVRRPELAAGEDDLESGALKFRWTFSFNDLW